MKKLTLPFLLSFASLTSFAQREFIIHGKIDLLSGSKNVRLLGFEPAPIRPDGSFEIKGEVNQGSVAMIKTDSSGSSYDMAGAGRVYDYLPGDQTAQ